MNWIKKHLKWIILGITILIAVIIAIIDYKQIYVALTLIPSVLLSFLQSNNEKQEKLAAMKIAKIEKEEREQEEQEKFEKMLNAVLELCIKYAEESNIKDDQVKKILDFKLDEAVCIRELITSWKFIDKCLYSSACRSSELQRNNFQKNLFTNSPFQGKTYLDILKQELPKILTPDVFDGEKLIV